MNKYKFLSLLFLLSTGVKSHADNTELDTPSSPNETEQKLFELTSTLNQSNVPEEVKDSIFSFEVYYLNQSDVSEEVKKVKIVKTLVIEEPQAITKLLEFISALNQSEVIAEFTKTLKTEETQATTKLLEFISALN